MARDAADDPAILVVEDDTDIREVLAEVLTRAGYRVECAVNGIQAMDWVRARRAGVPTLIILDVRMPVMDGRTFLTALAQEPAAAPAGGARSSPPRRRTRVRSWGCRWCADCWRSLPPRARS